MRKWSVLLIALIASILMCASPGLAASKIYGFTALSGSGTGALGAIDGAALADKDMAVGVVGGTLYTYYLDADSGVAESSPDIIAPSTHAGSKRWIRAPASSTAVDVLAQYGQGADRSSTAINAAITAIGSATQNIRLRTGVWSITDAIAFTDKIQPELDPGAYFSESTPGLVTGLKKATPEMFGAAGTGLVDDQAAYQAAADAVKNTDGILIDDPTHTYRIDSQLNLRYVHNLNLQGTIVVNFTGSPGVVVGADADSYEDGQAGFSPTKKYIRYIKNTANDTDPAPADPLLRIIGLQFSEVEWGICSYVQIYATNSLSPDDPSKAVANSKFKFVRTTTLELLDYATAQDIIDGHFGYINENTFEGIVRYLIVDGNYNHNNNRFNNLSFEGSGTIDFRVGSSNTVTFRGEGISSISFAAGTHNNTCIQTYASGANNQLTITPTVTDLGVGNLVHKDRWARESIYPILTITPDLPNHNGSTPVRGLANITPGLAKMTITDSNKHVFRNYQQYIPVIPGDVIHFISDSQSWRPQVYLYDENKVQITGATDPGYFTGIDWDWNAGGWYGAGVNCSIRRGYVLSSTVKFIRFVLVSGDSTAGDAFSYANAALYTVRDLTTITRLIGDGKGETITTASAPTNGYAPVGRIVAKSDGTALFINTFALETTLAEEVSASETADISVTDLTGVTAGDIVGLLLDDGTTYWDTVADVTGGDLTLTGAGPASVAASGNRIVFNRWINAAW